jgi:undecaprenyl-diphosphatase
MLLQRELEALQLWDRRLCVAMNRALRFGAALRLLRAVSWLGDGILWYALMLGLLVRHGQAAMLPVLHMVFVGAVCTATYKMVKRGTLRPRPFESLAAVAAGARPLDSFSFPSGHTLHAVGFSIVAIVHYPGLAVLLVPFTLLTAASRVALGLHYPSDVLAGAAIGAAIATASLWI